MREKNSQYILPLLWDIFRAESELHSCSVWKVFAKLLLFSTSSTHPSVCNTLKQQQCPVAEGLKITVRRSSAEAGLHKLVSL